MDASAAVAAPVMMAAAGPAAAAAPVVEEKTTFDVSVVVFHNSQCGCMVPSWGTGGRAWPPRWRCALTCPSAPAPQTGGAGGHPRRQEGGHLQGGARHCQHRREPGATSWSRRSQQHCSTARSSRTAMQSSAGLEVAIGTGWSAGGRTSPLTWTAARSSGRAADQHSCAQCSVPCGSRTAVGIPMGPRGWCPSVVSMEHGPCTGTGVH